MDMELLRSLSSALLCHPRTVRLHGIAAGTPAIRYQCSGLCSKTPGQPRKQDCQFQKRIFKKRIAGSLLPDRADEHREHDGDRVHAHPSRATHCCLQPPLMERMVSIILPAVRLSVITFGPQKSLTGGVPHRCVSSGDRPAGVMLVIAVRPVPGDNAVEVRLLLEQQPNLRPVP